MPFANCRSNPVVGQAGSDLADTIDHFDASLTLRRNPRFGLNAIGAGFRFSGGICIDRLRGGGAPALSYKLIERRYLVAHSGPHLYENGPVAAEAKLG